MATIRFPPTAIITRGVNFRMTVPAFATGRPSPARRRPFYHATSFRLARRASPGRPSLPLPISLLRHAKMKAPEAASPPSGPKMPLSGLARQADVRRLRLRTPSAPPTRSARPSSIRGLGCTTPTSGWKRSAPFETGRHARPGVRLCVAHAAPRRWRSGAAAAPRPKTADWPGRSAGWCFASSRMLAKSPIDYCPRHGPQADAEGQPSRAIAHPVAVAGKGDVAGRRPDERKKKAQQSLDELLTLYEDDEEGWFWRAQTRHGDGPNAAVLTTRRFCG